MSPTKMSVFRYFRSPISRSGGNDQQVIFAGVRPVLGRELRSQPRSSATGSSVRGRSPNVGAGGDRAGTASPSPSASDHPRPSIRKSHPVKRDRHGGGTSARSPKGWFRSTGTLTGRPAPGGWRRAPRHSRAVTARAHMGASLPRAPGIGQTVAAEMTSRSFSVPGPVDPPLRPSVIDGSVGAGK
jgi:hypothetical protein